MSKSDNLKILKEHGFNIPSFFVLEHDFIFEDNMGRLKDIYNQLIVETGELAIRSSAYTEDSLDLSMAGVYESFIGIKTFDDMLESIKNCIESLYSDKVLSLYIDNKTPKDLIKMEVIIQSFKRGAPSGVLFTVDPTKNNKDVIVISRVNSICKDFVDGTMESVTLKIDKNNPDTEDPILKELINESMKIEKLFDYPQDIEWTYSNNELWILQARPLTNLKLEKPPIQWNNIGDEKFTWKRHLKDVKPLNQEIAILSKEAYNSGCLISGLSFFYEDIMFYGNTAYLRNKELQDSKTIDTNYREYVDKLKSKGINIFIDIVLPSILKKQKGVESFFKRNLGPMELCKFIDVSLKYKLEVEAYHWQVVHGAVQEEELEEFKYKYNLTTLEAVELISSETLLGEQRIRFSEIVFYIKNSKPILDMFTEIKYDNLLWKELTRSIHSAGLLHLINKQIEYYGLNTLSWDSFEIFEESPEILISKIRPYLKIETKDLEYDITHVNSIKIEAMVLRRLPKDRREKFLATLSYLKKAYLVRDNHAMYIDIGAGGYFRKAIITIGKYFVNKGKLECYNDIEYFTLEQIKYHLLNPEVEMDIASKKNNWECSINTPDIIGLIPHVDKESQGVIAKSELWGLSGFTGQISGTIVKSNNIDNSLGRDLILVLSDIRQMDPEPYIYKLKGLIFENGSPLEHVGIWAREKGIPILFNVKGANSLLEEGEHVILDGDKEIIIRE